MAKIWTIIKQDLRVFLKQRSNLISLLLTPAVMTVIIALVDSGAFSGPAILRLDVIDMDRTPASAQFLAAIRQANPDLTLCPMDNTDKDICALGKAAILTESQALDRVANSTSKALLEIPSGYETSLNAQQPVTVTFRSSGDFSSSQAAQKAVQAALSQVNAAAVASQVGLSAINTLQGQALAGDQAQQARSALYQQALKMMKVKTITVDFALSGSPEGQTMGGYLQYGLGQSVPGMGIMFALMNIFGAMAALVVERQQWTLQRLAAMPVSRSTLLAGKILARFCLGLMQFLVVFIVGAFFKMNFGKDPLALVLLVIVCTLSITAFAFAVGSGLKNPAQASGLGLLLTLTLAPIGGAWWPMYISPKFLQIIGHVSPVAWAMDGFTALTYNGATLVDIWVPLAVLTGMTIVLFLIAIPRFRYQVD
jgi:linearmycin/streptolysin S transport system permease protein